MKPYVSCENLYYESVYFKELNNDQGYYLKTTWRGGLATITVKIIYYVSFQTNGIKQVSITTIPKIEIPQNRFSTNLYIAYFV